jgi:hypothetical protein
MAALHGVFTIHRDTTRTLDTPKKHCIFFYYHTRLDGFHCVQDKGVTGFTTLKKNKGGNITKGIWGIYDSMSCRSR